MKDIIQTTAGIIASHASLKVLQDVCLLSLDLMHARLTWKSICYIFISAKVNVVNTGGCNVFRFVCLSFCLFAHQWSACIMPQLVSLFVMSFILMGPTVSDP